MMLLATMVILIVIQVKTLQADTASSPDISDGIGNYFVSKLHNHMVNLSKNIYDGRHNMNMMNSIITEMNENVQKMKLLINIPTPEVTMYIDGLKPYGGTSIFEVIKHCLAHLGWLEKSLYEYRVLSQEANQDFYNSLNRTNILEKKLNLALLSGRYNRRSSYAPISENTLRYNLAYQ